jgi:hypothetical protein
MGSIWIPLGIVEHCRALVIKLEDLKIFACTTTMLHIVLHK